MTRLGESRASLRNRKFETLFPPSPTSLFRRRLHASVVAALEDYERTKRSQHLGHRASERDAAADNINVQMSTLTGGSEETDWH